MKINKYIEYVVAYIKITCEFLGDYFSFQSRKVICHKSYKELKKLKNMYEGKRCFIIGTGPSLVYEDVEKLKDEYTFGVNSFIKALPQISFLPTFYGIIDGACMDLYGNEILNSGIKYIFFTQKRDLKKEEYKRLKKMKTYEFPQMDIGNWAYYAKKIPKRFSEDITKEVFWGYTVTYSMMQIAAYMGFKEIYLLGMDCSYDPGVENFMDHRSAERIERGDYQSQSGTVDKFVEAYEEAKRYSEAKNIKIYNATRGGKLEVFSRVILEEIV